MRHGMIMVATLVVATALAGQAGATTAAQKCEEQKLKAAGKLKLCLKKSAAKVVAGKPDRTAECQMKFSAAVSRAGTACHYLDNGDGTVSDLDTGLQWEKKDNLDSTVNVADPHDADNTYTWCSGPFSSCTNSANPPDGTAYTDFLSKLNDGVSTDGGASTAITGALRAIATGACQRSWELWGILDVTQGNCGGGNGACIDPAFGPTQADSYWSATNHSSAAFAWTISLYFGDTGPSNKTDDRYVRAVRGGLPLPPPPTPTPTSTFTATATGTATATSTATATATITPTPCSGGGAGVGGSCWYLGASAASCDAACAGIGQVCDPATISYAGTGGTSANCAAVLTALSVTDAYSGDLSCAPQGAGCIDSPGTFSARCTDVPTTCAAATLARRACACHP